MTVAILMLLIQILYCAYVFGVRPYRAKLETFFVNAIALAQLGSAVCCVGSNITHDPYLTIIGYLVLVQSALYMGSMVALGGWYLYVKQRRLTKFSISTNVADQKHRDMQDRLASSKGGEEAPKSLMVPLLESEEGAGPQEEQTAAGSAGPQQHQHNPLVKAEL